MENNNVHVHTFTQTVIPPTCKEKGYTLHKCECGYEHKDNFKPLADHDFDVIEETKPTCTEGGARKATCKVCGITVDEATPPSGHTWGEWIISEFATCTEEGSQAHVCTVCGASETQAIKPTGHKFAQGQEKKVDGYVEHFCENCGETVKVPTRSTKIKGFIKSHKAVVIIPCILAVIAALFVLSIKVFAPAYHYNKANKLIEQGDYAEAYSLLTRTIGYKDTGELIDNIGFENSSYVLYDENGEKEFYVNERIAYDNHGKVVSVKSFYTDEENCSTETYENEYDENGKLVRRRVYSSDDDIYVTDVYKYDKNGNMTQEFSYDSVGNLTYRAEHKYDKNGNMTQEFSYDSVGNLTYRAEHKHDKNGNTTKIISYGLNNKISAEYEFDKNSNTMSKITYYDENGELESVYEITHEYTDNKLIIKGKMYDKDGEYTGKYITTYSNAISYSAK